MKSVVNRIARSMLILLVSIFLCCHSNKSPDPEAIRSIGLKKGDIIYCGSSKAEFGTLSFETSCTGTADDFNLAVQLLHSFEYDEAEKAFAKIIDRTPDCAMAYWGVAMSNFHPLWTPPTEEEIIKGSKAIEIARSIEEKSARESAYIEAIGNFYDQWQTKSHGERCFAFERAMENLHTEYPQDIETAIFYALALDASAEPTDKTFAKQKKAGKILQSLYLKYPNHPGIVHYLIHTYDYPGLAIEALPAAKVYAAVAPASAHAQHMPSHIFTRLGMWNESIQSNLACVKAAACYGEESGMKGHWDEELHGLDYLIYAYLQKGNNDSAKKQLEYLKAIHEVFPENSKVAYAFASIPARIALENKDWKAATELQFHPAGFPWKKFPWQQAIIHFARGLGHVHQKELTGSEKELSMLKELHDQLEKQKDSYKSGQVFIQITTLEAWMKLKSGNQEEALKLMSRAADLEDATEKHPVTPGSVLPAREMLADMFMELNKPEKALEEYQLVLANNPNRFNSLYGAGLAALRSGKKNEAAEFFNRLNAIVNKSSDRREYAEVKKMLDR